MTAHTRSWPRRFAAAASAFAIGLIGLAGGALGASADTAISAGNIDPAKNTVLTIHKYDGNPSTAGDGTEQNASTFGNPLAGVEFTITPVSAKGGSVIDLDTAAGWDLIDGIKATDVYDDAAYQSDATIKANGGYTLDAAGQTKVTTGADGSVSTGALPHGLYLVTESGYGPNTIKSGTAPFLVTLPLPQAKGGWLYDVHVYPKNQVDTNTPTKQVGKPTDGVVIGSTVPWTISAPVQPDKPGAISSFKITDKLDGRLSFVSADVQGYASGTDYTVTNENGLITVEFTKAGLTKLKSGDVVTVNLNTKVESLGNGVIENSAVVFTNDNGGHATSVPGEPGTNPKTNWGPLEVLKYAQGDETKTLSGAEFTVYSDKDATKAVGAFTTDANGKGSIVLWVGSDTDITETYWLKETKAPAGYTLDDQIREVTVNAGDAASAVAYKIANVQKDHPSLPLTGASGMIVMTIVGVALIGAGAGAYVVVRKRASVH